MSKTVDQRVVEMQFDNRHFERNVSTTMSTLDKLKKSLQLPDASKSLDGINHAARNVNLSSLSSAVETVQTKFSALQVIGVTALANITNSAVNAGKRIVKSLTIDPVTTGFQEYELKMNSLRTIMASTGESLDVVNSYLNELNEYSDQTIYSFSDMTQNIGKFTNAGVKLEDAVAAIKGISNEAAVSGANANEASRAMYNFAQALSAGYVKLIDWKSIENANMATVEFKNELIETALHLKTVTKGADGMYKTLDGNLFNATKNFNEVLQDQWMTSDVLIETLKRYADANSEIGKKATEAATKVRTFTQLMDTLKESVQSGWARTWEILVGDYYKAEDLFTDISEAVGGFINKMSDARNSILEDIFSSPWDNLTKKISESGIEITEYEEAVKKVANTHNISAKKFEKLIKKYNGLSGAVQAGAISADILKEALEELGISTDKSSGSVDDFVDGLKTIQRLLRRGSVGDDVKKLQTALDKLGYSVGECGIDGIIGPDTISAIKEFQKEVGIAVDGIAGPETIAALEKAGTKVGEVDESYADLLKTISQKGGRELLLESFANILDYINAILEPIKEAWKETFGDVNIADGVYNLIEKFHDLTEKMEVSETAANNLKTVFEGVFAAFKIGNLIVSKSLVAGLKILDAVLELFSMDIVDAATYVAGLIKSLGEWLDANVKVVDTVDKVARIIKTFVDGVKGIIDAFLSLPQVQSAIDKFKGYLTDLFDFDFDGTAIDNVCATIENLLTRVKDWISTLKDSDNLGRDLVQGIANGIAKGIQVVVSWIANLAQKIIDVFCEITGIASPSKVFFVLGGFIVAGLIGGMIDRFPEVWNTLKGLGSHMVDVFKNIELGHIFAAVLSTGLLLVVRRILNIIDKLANPVEGFGKLMSKLGGMFSDIGEARMIEAKASKWKGIAKMITSIALAIGAITAAIYILGNMENYELKRAVAALAVVGVIVVAIMALSKLIGKLGGAPLSFASLISIAGSLLLLSLSLKLLANPDLGDVSTAIDAMGAIVLCMMGLVATFGTFVGGDKAKYMNKAGKMFIKLSVAMLMMTGVIKLLASMTQGEINQAMEVIAGVSLLFGSIVALSALTGAHVNKVGRMILNMAIAMLAMVGVVKLASMLTSDEIAAALPAIALIGVLFAALIAISNIAGRNAAKAGIMILAMSAAFGLLVQVIEKTAELDRGTVAKGLLIMYDIGLLFAGLILVSQLAGNNAIKAGVMLLLMAGAMMILVGVIYMLSSIKDPEGMQRALNAIATIGIIFAALIAVTALAKDCKATLVVLTVAVALLAVAIAALSFIPAEDLAAATAALTMVIGMFALLVLATKNVGQATGTLIAMSVALVAMGAVLYILRDLDPVTGLAAAASLSILLLAMAAVLKIIEGLNAPSVMALVTLGVVTLVVVALALVLKTLQEIDPTKSLVIVGILTAFLAVLLVAVLAMQALGGPSPLALAALAIVTVVIIALAAVLYALQSVDPSQAIGIVGAIAAFLAVMLVVVLAASAIGPTATAAIPALAILVAFIGALGLVVLALADLAMDIIARMPQLGTDLSNFMKNAQPFIDGIQNVPDNIGDKVGKLCAAIGKLTTQELWNSIKEFFSGGDSLADMGAELKEFGECIGSFTTNAKATSVEAVVSAIKDLINMDFSSADEGVEKLCKSMKTLAQDAVEAFAEAMSSNTSKAEAKDAVGKVIDAASEKAKSETSYTAFYNAGGRLVEGLANGIRDSKSKATSAAKEVADAVEAIIRAAWAINSPSKLFYGIALGIGEGVVNALDDSGSSVTGSADTFANRVTRGFTAALAKVNDSISNDLDTQPTIRPVLDLTNVESGVGTLNGMLGNSSVGVSAHIGAISTMMSGRGQNGTNRDVVTAIDRLSKNLGRTGDTYNVNGITYDDGSNVSDAVRVLVRAARVERRV